MWESLIAIAVVAAIAAVEVPALTKRRYWRTLFAFFTMLLLGLSILIFYFTGVEVPSPLEPLRIAFEPVGKALRRE